MVKSKPHLFPSYEKIKRAKSKFDHLKTGINAYVASHPYSFRIDGEWPRIHYVARREKAPPDDIAFEVVEAVGHLRSALDKMLVALVELNGRGTSGVGFPFGGMDNGKPLPIPNPRTGTIEQKLSPEQWNLVVAQRPYPGGNDTLWGINQIANTDKHGRDLVDVTPVLGDRVGLFGSGTEFSGPAEIIVLPDQDNTLLYDYERERVLVTVIGGKGELSIKAEPTPTIVFSELAPVTGKNVLTTLNQQIRITEGIIETFRKAFF